MGMGWNKALHTERRKQAARSELVVCSGLPGLVGLSRRQGRAVDCMHPVLQVKTSFFAHRSRYIYWWGWSGAI